MQKMPSIDKKTINIVVKYGFTFSGDSHFISYISAKRCLNRLERLGYLLKISSNGRVEYRATQKSLDFVTLPNIR